MARVPRIATVFSLVFALSACSGSDPVGPAPVQTRPPNPSPTIDPPPPPPPPTTVPPALPTATIKLVGMSPDPGASLTVEGCVVNGLPRDCASWSGAFEVTLTGEIRWPVLTVGFYDGAKLCGYAAATVGATLPVGVPVTFQPSSISLTDEWGSFNPPCVLPAKATRMVAVLWTDDNWNFLVTQEFPVHYTFVRP